VYLIAPDSVDSTFSGAVSASLDMHSMNPMNVLRTVKSMGGAQGRILIVGCEPAELGGEEGQLGLSDPVHAAVDEAIAMIETLISREAVLQAQ
jgi:hydrogenase maturation protease